MVPKEKYTLHSNRKKKRKKGAQHRRGDQGPIIYLVNPETWLRPLLIICLHLGATTKVPLPKYQSATTKVPLLKYQSATTKVPKCYYQSATTKVPKCHYQSATTKVPNCHYQSTKMLLPKCRSPKNNISKDSELLNSDTSFIQNCFSEPAI